MHDAELNRAASLDFTNNKGAMKAPLSRFDQILVSGGGDGCLELKGQVLQVDSFQYLRLVGSRECFNRSLLVARCVYDLGGCRGDGLLTVKEVDGHIRAVPFPDQLVVTRRDLSACNGNGLSDLDACGILIRGKRQGRE